MLPRLSGTDLRTKLDQDGILVLPGFVPSAALGEMQRAFGAILCRQRWNDIDGYEKTERYRLMVQHVLTLDQGFVDAALNPAILVALREYIGTGFQLVEAKGWESVPTRRDFHGWHGDAWYDQRAITDTIPREVKLALYLTDVTSGYFEYVRGSHRRLAPRLASGEEAAQYSSSEVLQAKGPAGTAILFDTSGIHRQSVPVLAPRWAVFYNYHDPSVPLQPEDLEYNRYHPLILNAALLGQLDAEDRRVLGFGDKRNFRPAFRRQTSFVGFQRTVERAHGMALILDEFRSRVAARLRRMVRGADH